MGFRSSFEQGKIKNMFKKLSRARIILFSFFVVFCLLFFLIPLSVNLAFASETDGTIDSTYKYAWGENIGWLNFGCDNCNVQITDNGISGNAWSRQYGWINLNPTTSGVLNTAEGVLSGFAWSSNLGWINFTGVTINSSGEFLGYATIESDSSQINFNCAGIVNSCSLADFKVKTDWRPASMRHHNSSSGYILPRPPILSPTTPPVLPSTIPPVIPPTTPPVIVGPANPIVSVMDNVGATINSFFDSILSFFRPKNKPAQTSAVVQIPKITPLSFSKLWNLLPVEAIRTFVFAPLPYEVRILATKFPELDRTFKSVGVKRMTDMSKLTGATLNLPGLTELTNTLKAVGAERLADLNKLSGVTLDIPGLSNIDQKIGTNIGTGKIALIQGLPLAKFSLSAKKNLPAEFVFARVGGELVDLNVAMSIGDKGEVIQKISSLPGEKMRLVVKPISKAKSVTGYFVFKSPTPRITRASQTEISRSSLTASALFSLNDLVEKVPTKTSPQPPGEERGKAPSPFQGKAGDEVENKLVLSSFEYTDPDHDGIYTADVVSPTTPGEYEVITVIDYIDPVLGTRQMRMIAVIDPEGYVFERNNGKETRIPSAIVSLYYLNVATKKYELWPAKEYQQENPQITDVRGTYAFLVPEGSYHFEVVAPGYEPYQGKVFLVAEGNSIHQNIELKSGRGFFSNLDWRTILLIVVFLLLVYNSVRSRLRQ